MRELANAAHVSVPGLYHYFSTKQEILIAIVTRVMDDLVTLSETSLTQAGNDPLARLEALITTVVTFQATRSAESFVGNSELRSLESPHREYIIAKHDLIQRYFDRAIQDGKKKGLFRTDLDREASRAILRMTAAVADWYAPSGPLNPSQIARQYTQLALNMLGAHVPQAKSAS